MGATFSRVKNWIAETLSFADLNAEINNILTNFLPAGMDDYSVNVAQMQTKTDPGELASESLATSLAGELERIRFAIAEIKGTDEWYQTADSSLEELAAVLGGGLISNRLISGKTSSNSGQPLYLVPNGSAATLVLEGASTTFSYTIAYDRSGKPKYGIVIGQLENGIRTIASLTEEQDILLKFETKELIGKQCEVEFDPNSGRNIAKLL